MLSQISFEASINNCSFKKIKANTLLTSEKYNMSRFKNKTTFAS